MENWERAMADCPKAIGRPRWCECHGWARKEGEVVSSDNRMMAKDEEMDRLRREARENIAKGEAWTCGCGKVVVNSFACPVCGLTVIGSDMERERERIARERGADPEDVVRLDRGYVVQCKPDGEMVIHKAERGHGEETWDQEVDAIADLDAAGDLDSGDVVRMGDELGSGDPDAGSGEGVDGGVVAGAGAEEGGYTHGEDGGGKIDVDEELAELHEIDEGLEITFDEEAVVYGGPDVILPHDEPSEEDVRAYEKMYRGEATGSNYLLGLFFMYCLVAIVFFLIGLLYGKATYGF